MKSYKATGRSTKVISMEQIAQYISSKYTLIYDESERNGKCSYCTDTVDVIEHFLSNVQLYGKIGISLKELFCESVVLR